MTKLMDYETYLQSKPWKGQRKWILWRSGGVCEIPLCMNPVENVHHCKVETGEPCYDNLYQEGPFDLLGVCREHHIKLHEGWRIERNVLVPFVFLRAANDNRRPSKLIIDVATLLPAA